MKTVYIFRHAEAESKDDDFSRHLTERGHKQALKMEEKLPEFDVAISSPAFRTFITAVLLTSKEISIHTLDPLYDLVDSSKIAESYSRLKGATPKEWYEDEKIGDIVQDNESDYMPSIRETIMESDEGSNILIVAHAVVVNIIAKNLMDGYGKDQRWVMGLNLGECECIKVELDLGLLSGVHHLKYEV